MGARQTARVDVIRGAVHTVVFQGFLSAAGCCRAKQQMRQETMASIPAAPGWKEICAAAQVARQWIQVCLDQACGSATCYTGVGMLPELACGEEGQWVVQPTAALHCDSAAVGNQLRSPDYLKAAEEFAGGTVTSVKTATLQGSA